jgi:hypothetical protein
MSFNYVTIHDGGVAGLELCGHAVLGLDLAQIGGIFHNQTVPILTHILHPAAAAASARRSEDLNGPNFLGFRGSRRIGWCATGSQ